MNYMIIINGCLVLWTVDFQDNT